MAVAFLWDVPKQFPCLCTNEVHVWCFSLEQSTQQLNNFFNLFAENEKTRAQRFRFEKDRNAYIAGRGTLRTILAAYLQCDPKAVQFDYNAYGKPQIRNDPSLQFNLSHSKNVALCAITRHNPIGIDIEYMLRDCDMDAIAERFFSASESQLLHSLVNDEKIQGFFNAWTRKEAFLKAFGQGLSYSLKRVEVSIVPHQSAKFLALHDVKQNLAEWFIQALNPINDYAAALVVHGHPIRVNTWRWDG